MNVILLLEQNNSSELPGMLQSNFGLTVSGVHTGSYDALTAIREQRPNAVFIDLDTKGLDIHAFVFEIERLKSDTAIILLSSTDSFAIEAFRMNVLDYLLKPVTADRLAVTADKLEKRFHTAAVKKTPSKVSVNVFGTFMVMVGDNPVRWQTAKGAEIFAYLLLHQKKSGIDKWKIINAIWNNKSEESADLNFRSSLSRLNQTLKNFNTGITIKNMQGSYRLEYGDIEVDAFRLEAFAKSETPLSDAHAKEIEELLLSYDGDLFSGFDFQWAKPFCENTIQNINLLSKRLSRYYIGKKKYSAAESIISHNLLTNAGDKEAHEIKLELLYLAGRNADAEKYYQELLVLFHDNLGVEFTKKLKKYQKVNSAAE